MCGSAFSSAPSFCGLESPRCHALIAQSPEFDCNGGITALGRHTLRVIDCLLLLLLLLLHTAFVCGPAFDSDCTLPSISGSDGGSSAIRN